jgi:hypothetical protein
MIVTRRGFLTGILALGAAPAIVRADSLMRIVPRSIATRPADIMAIANLAGMRSYCMSFYIKASDGQWERGIFHAKSMKPPSALTAADFNIPPIYGRLFNAQLEEF